MVSAEIIFHPFDPERFRTDPEVGRIEKKAICCFKKARKHLERNKKPPERQDGWPFSFPRSEGGQFLADSKTIGFSYHREGERGELFSTGLWSLSLDDIYGLKISVQAETKDGRVGSFTYGPDGKKVYWGSYGKDLSKFPPEVFPDNGRLHDQIDFLKTVRRLTEMAKRGDVDHRKIAGAFVSSRQERILNLRLAFLNCLAGLHFRPSAARR